LDRLVRPATAGHVASLFDKDIALAEGLADDAQTAIGVIETLVRSFVGELHRLGQHGAQ
jgi:hypothetical protein